MSHALAITSEQSALIRNQFVSAFDVLLYSLSETSKRQYKHTYKRWLAFATENNFKAWDLSAQNIIAFLESEDLAHSTKQARLSHLRKLVETLHAEDTSNATVKDYHAQVQLIKIKRTEQSAKNERDKKALKPREVYAAFDVWSGDSLVCIRNRALLAVAFYAGLRRSEIAALTWDCIDYDNGMVLVRHGKGDKERTVPFVSDSALDYLQDWQRAMPSHRRYIFCGIKNKGNGQLRADKPMHPNSIRNVMQKSGDFNPHDARRTIITDLLNNGTSVADTQFIAGHANPSTTLGYAQVKDAKEVKGRIKTSLG